MAREFDRNMFIMLFAIMIGAIIITFFIADLVSRGKIEILEESIVKYQSDIVTLKEENENFTSNFIKSSIILDQAGEDRGFGNYYYDLGVVWFSSITSEKNIEIYRSKGIENTTFAMRYYTYSNLNFIDANEFFRKTKNFTNVQKYYEILDLYIDLTDKGAEMTLLRYDESLYLTYLLENITYNSSIGAIEYLTNVTELLDLFNQTKTQYFTALNQFQEILKQIDAYRFWEDIR
jgi:hypothetical protein